MGSSTRRAGPTYEAHGCRFYNMDCVAGARNHLPDASVDLIVSDPPYGISGHTMHKHYHRKEGFVVGGYRDVDAKEYSEFTVQWIQEAARVLRPGGQLYVVSGYTHLYEILHALRQTGLQEVNHIIWRFNFGVFTRNKYVSGHYHILYYAKPGRRRTFNTESRFGLNERAPDGSSLNYEDRQDVWSIGREYKHGLVRNKNELPLELLTKIILYSSRPGDVVCDFFLGGFSTAKAAIGLGRRATGFEISSEAFEARFAELEAVQPGALLSSVRAPQQPRRPRQGARWTAAETSEVVERYRLLRVGGATKKSAIERLSREFERGRFAILNVLDRQGGPYASRTRGPAPSVQPRERFA